MRSTASDYAANVEAVVVATPDPIDASNTAEAQSVETPGCTTIDDLVAFSNQNDEISGRFDREITAADTLKSIVVKTRSLRKPKDEKNKKKSKADAAAEAAATAEQPWEYHILAIPGDREVDMSRVEAAYEPQEVELVDEADFAKHPALVKGYVGPIGMDENEIPVYLDTSIPEGSRWIVGGNAENTHIVDAVVGRDFTATGTIGAAEIREGDPAPDGKGTLTLKRGIEIGHIFQLGRKYTEAFDMQILNETGSRSVPTMGSYGVGVSRLIGVLAEQRHDDKGLNWPVEVAPFAVHIVIANKDEAAREAAESLASELSDAGIEVLLDDRPKVSPGVKFKDSELLGMPYVVVLGRTFQDGELELRDRATGETSMIPADQAVETVTKLVK